MKVILKTTSVAVDGRNGHVKNLEGPIDLDLGLPKELGGEGNANLANPEQLFSAGYAACFDSAIGAIADIMKVKVESETSLTISLLKVPDGFCFSADIKAKIDGVDKETAQDILEKAHGLCPYSKAVKGNVETTISLVD